MPIENPFSQLINGFLGKVYLQNDALNNLLLNLQSLFGIPFLEEDIANYSATQIKKKVDPMESKETKLDVSEIGSVQEDTDLRTEPQPCSCVYQHVREITERKKGVLENPPCPCLLNSKRKWNTCPCLTKCNYERRIKLIIALTVPSTSLL